MALDRAQRILERIQESSQSAMRIHEKEFPYSFQSLHSRSKVFVEKAISRGDFQEAQYLKDAVSLGYVVDSFSANQNGTEYSYIFDNGYRLNTRDFDSEFIKGGYKFIEPKELNAIKTERFKRDLTSDGPPMRKLLSDYPTLSEVVTVLAYAGVEYGISTDKIRIGDKGDYLEKRDSSWAHVSQDIDSLEKNVVNGEIGELLRNITNPAYQAAREKRNEFSFKEFSR